MYKYRIILDITREKKMTMLNVEKYTLEGDEFLDEEKAGPLAILVSGCGIVKIKNVIEKEV